MEEKEKPIRYGTFTMRLSDSTIGAMKKARAKTGKTWNRFIYELLKGDKNV